MTELARLTLEGGQLPPLQPFPAFVWFGFLTRARTRKLFNFHQVVTIYKTIESCLRVALPALTTSGQAAV